MIGAEPEFAAGFQHAGNDRQRPRVGKSPLGMARLGPGVGVEQEHPVETGIGQPVEHIERIAIVEADIGQPAIADFEQRADDAIDEGFGADDADMRVGRCLRRHVFTPAKADFEPQGPIVTEQGSGADRPGFGYGKARQQLFDQRRLADAQLVAGAAAVEPADGGGIGRHCHCPCRSRLHLESATRLMRMMDSPPERARIDKGRG